MKKVFSLLLCLVVVPMLFAANNDAERYLAPANSYTNLNPQPVLDDNDGRAFGDQLLEINLASIGMPGDGYDNAGITWDGTYLYLISMFDNQVYVIDPTGPSIVTNWAAAPSLAWGFGHEVNLWMTEYYSGFCYEYDWSGSATGNSFACVQGGASWMGDASEWYTSGSIWLVAVGGDNNVYEFTVPGGSVLGSISNSAWNYISERGFSYDPWNDHFYIGGWNTQTIWEIDNTGAPTGRQCSLTNIASLAYDWQSTIHPTPVLWAATNEATNRIFMLDADNPNPNPAAHDVGVAAILAPTGNIMPSTPIDPQARYHNYGDSSEVFDIYFSIDSSGTQVYYQTDNITLASGGDTTYTWPAWTPGPNDGITYDVTAWTVLSGDENPANDTMTTTCTTLSAYWKIYSSSLPSAVYYNTTATLDVSGNPMVYSIGGDANLNTINEFDVGTETWTTSSATLGTGVQRTAATPCQGIVYVCAGCDGSFNAVNAMQAFDPVAGTVTPVTNVPTATGFNGAVTWNDTLVYVLGGQDGATYYNLVQIYDPASDSWTTGTAMPMTNRSFACGIFEDNIYVAGGFNGGYITGAWVGAIDPGNPTNITWTALPDIPTGASGTPGRSRVQGACDAWGHFYFVGGDDHGVPGVDCHYYDPGDGQWHQDLDKPTAMTNTQAADFVNDLDGGTFFCAGGYNGSGGSTATEGLINLGQYGIAELPGDIDLNRVGFASMANPVKGVADIVFTVAQQSHVTLKVFDRTGRMVEQLVDRPLPAGICAVSWNTTDVPNGVYFLTLDAAGQTDTHKMVVVK